MRHLSKLSALLQQAAGRTSITQLPLHQVLCELPWQQGVVEVSPGSVRGRRHGHWKTGRIWKDVGSIFRKIGNRFPQVRHMGIKLMISVQWLDKYLDIENTRSLDDLERTGYPANSLLTDALTKTFIGQYFYFGFKQCDITGSNKRPCLSDILKTAADNSVEGSQFHKDADFENVHNLAYQMLPSNSNVHASVTDHMRYSVSILRQSSDINNSVNNRGCAIKRPSFSTTTLSNLSGESSANESKSSMYRTCSFILNQDSVQFTFEENDTSHCKENLGVSRLNSVDRDSVMTDNHHIVSVSNECRKPECLSAEANSDSRSSQSFNIFSQPLSQLDFSSSDDSDFSNTSKKIDRELIRRLKNYRQPYTDSCLLQMTCSSQYKLDNMHLTQQKESILYSHTDDQENALHCLKLQHNVQNNATKSPSYCTSIRNTLQEEEGTEFSDNNKISFILDSHFDTVFAKPRSHTCTQLMVGDCETCTDNMESIADTNKVNLQNDKRNVEYKDVSLYLCLPDSEGLETFLGTQYSQCLNFDQTYKTIHSVEIHETDTKLPDDEQHVRIDSTINAQCESDYVQSCKKVISEQVSSGSDSGICDLVNECAEVVLKKLSSETFEESLNDGELADLDLTLFFKLKTNDKHVSNTERVACTSTNSSENDSMNDFVEKEMPNVSAKVKIALIAEPDIESQDLEEFLENISITPASNEHTYDDRNTDSNMVERGTRDQVVTHEHINMSNIPSIKNCDSELVSIDAICNRRVSAISEPKTDRIERKSKTDNATIHISESLDLREFLANISDTETAKVQTSSYQTTSTGMIENETFRSANSNHESPDSDKLKDTPYNLTVQQAGSVITAVKDVGDNELKCKTAEVINKELWLDTTFATSYCDNYSDIFTDSFSDNSSADICDLNIAVTSSDNIFDDSVVVDIYYASLSESVNESCDLFDVSSDINSCQNKTATICVSETEEMCCQDSLIDSHNDEHKHFLENVGRSEGMPDCASSPDTDESFIADSPQTKNLSGLLKLSNCSSSHNVLANGAAEKKPCDKKKVQFDRKLRRVSSCQILDIKMRNCGSPTSTSISVRKSCLKRERIYDKTKCDLLEKQDVCSDSNQDDIHSDNRISNAYIHMGDMPLNDEDCTKDSVDNISEKPVTKHKTLVTLLEELSSVSEPSPIINISGSQDLFSSSPIWQNKIYTNIEQNCSVRDRVATNVTQDELSSCPRKASIEDVECKRKSSEQNHNVEMTPDLWSDESSFDDNIMEDIHLSECRKGGFRNNGGYVRILRPSLLNREVEPVQTVNNTDVSTGLPYVTTQKGCSSQKGKPIVHEKRQVLKCLVPNTPGHDSKMWTKCKKICNEVGQYQTTNTTVTYRRPENMLENESFCEDSPDLFGESPVYNVANNACDITDSAQAKSNFIRKKLFFDY